MQLRNRLQAVCDFISKGNVVADIGTDHAYLPIYLIEQQISPKAFACDIHSGPYNAACRAVAQAGMENQITVRLGDGMTVLAPGEADTVVIAGMGGTTMIDILTNKLVVTNSLQRLILQPMNAAKNLRIWLLSNQWRIVNENLVMDEGRLYEIICAEPGEEIIDDSLLYDIGPRIWESRHPMLKEHLLLLLAQENRALLGMSGSARAKLTPKYDEAKERVRRLEEKLKCL